jgi:uncharacterized phiE125 gp8 family phage protein
VADVEIDCAWDLTTPPVLEPFTVAEAKDQIRSVQDQEDGLVSSYIKAARAAAEAHLGRGLLTQTWTLALSDFVSVIPLPFAAPLQSVTSVKYYDENETQQTLATSIYTVDTRNRPGRLALAAGQSWPSVSSSRRVNRIEIAYVVGWTAKELIPEDIKQGMRVLIGMMDADRDGMEPGSEQALRVAKAFWTDRVFWTPPEYD